MIAAFAGGAGAGALQPIIPAFAVGYVLIMSLLGTILIQQADSITVLLEPLLT